MPEQASVIVGNKEWVVSIASTLSEITTGLSGLPGMAAGTGVLFDLGVDQSYIRIDMSRMLFNLDIIFISTYAGVSGMLRNVAPGEEAAFQATNTPEARYFLEVNAGEAEGVEVGNDVVIQGEVQPSFWQYVGAALLLLPVVIPMFTSMAKELERKQ